MSGRAVGGAAGAGCGAFTLVGLLLGIGLTVWLGSQVVGGGGSSKSEKDANDAASSALKDLTSSTVPGSVDARQSIRLSPPTGYAPDATIKVSGSGFHGEVQLLTCAKGEPRFADGSGGCDLDTATTATAQADGMLLADYVAHGTITVIDTPVDCTASPGACIVVASRPDHPDEGVTADLDFGTG